jgi:hypothetical protein
MKPPKNSTPREIVKDAIDELEQFVRATPAKRRQNVVSLSSNAAAASGEEGRPNTTAGEKSAARGTADTATAAARPSGVSDALD